MYCPWPCTLSRDVYSWCVSPQLCSGHFLVCRETEGIYSSILIYEVAPLLGDWSSSTGNAAGFFLTVYLALRRRVARKGASTLRLLHLYPSNELAYPALPIPWAPHWYFVLSSGQ